MTEEIIIDGCNVKDCRRRIGKNSYCRYYKRPCADNNYNCVWKQNLRLKQENEELGKIIDSKNGTIATLANIRDDLKQENEKLKEKVKELDAMTGIFSARLASKYKQALEEIKNIILTYESKEWNCFNDMDIKLEEISKVINEVLGDECRE